MLHLDDIPYQSPLRSLDPGFKLFFSVGTMLLMIVLNQLWISAAVFVLMVALTLFWGKCNVRRYLALLSIPLLFIIVGVLTIMIDRSDELLVSFGFWGLGISAGGYATAIAIFGKSLAAVVSLYFLIINTPINDIIEVLRKLHVPNFLLELMILIYRFITLMVENAEQILTAQKCRLGYVDYRTSFQSLALLMARLFSVSYERGQRVMIAQESRNYDGDLVFYPIAYTEKNRYFVYTVLFWLLLILGKGLLAL